LLQFIVKCLKLLGLFVHRSKALRIAVWALTLVASVVVAGVKRTGGLVVDQGILINGDFGTETVVLPIVMTLLLCCLLAHQVGTIVFALLRLDLVHIVEVWHDVMLLICRLTH
jgi:hypothetical protein